MPGGHQCQVADDVLDGVGAGEEHDLTSVQAGIDVDVQAERRCPLLDGGGQLGVGQLAFVLEQRRAPGIRSAQQFADERLLPGARHRVMLRAPIRW